jgi:glyoxylase-like metal-dependent hydrolase (beta-lactamase superfamily II)
MIDAQAVARRRIGDIEAAVVNAGTLSGWVPCFAPGQDWVTADDDIALDGSATGGINWMLIRTEQAVVLVDPATFRPGQVIGRARLTAGAPIEAALAQLAVSPGDVTHVIVSHLHIDHAGGLVPAGATVPRFPHAVHVVSARDWDHFIIQDAAGDAAELMEQLGPPQRSGLLRLVEGDTEVRAGRKRRSQHRLPGRPRPLPS